MTPKAHENTRGLYEYLKSLLRSNVFRYIDFHPNMSSNSHILDIWFEWVWDLSITKVLRAKASPNIGYFGHI